MDAESNFQTNKRSTNSWVKYILIGVAIIIVAVALGEYFLITNNIANQPKAYQFKGHFVSAEGNILKVLGVYADKEGKVVNPSLQPNEAAVEVTAETLIQRESSQIPTTSGVFYPDKLPKVTSIADVAKVVEDSKITELGFVVESDLNIYKKNSFKASKITYRVPLQGRPQ